MFASHRPKARLGLEPLESRDVPAFGTGGFVAGGTGFVALDSVVQPDDKVIVVGLGGGGRTAPDFAVARFNADGTLDTGFGANGVATLDFKGKWDQPHAVALQPDGKIVVGGYANVSSGGAPLDTAFALARFNANGSVDSSFGSRGKVLNAFGDRRDQITDVVVQGGKIVVGGNTTSFGGGDDFIVARYTAAGKPDTTFDGDGVAVANLGGADAVDAVAVRPDGRVVAAGNSQRATGPSAGLSVVQFLPGGGLDPGFGAGGVVSTGYNAGAAEVLLDAAGRVVLGSTLNSQFAVFRFLPAGGLDASFGVGGIATLATPGPYGAGVNGMAFDPNGDIVLAGTRVNDPQDRDRDDIVVTRVRGTDGSLDAAFGSGGWSVVDATPAVGSDSGDRLSAVAVDSQGRIVLAGEYQTTAPDARDVLLVRLKADGTPDV